MRVPEVDYGWMTDQQCGRILRLSDELSEWDLGLGFIARRRTYTAAAEYIRGLENRFEFMEPRGASPVMEAIDHELRG
jgi:hypothetical protein